MKSTPSHHGDLPPIPPYEIERHWFLHELRNIRAVLKLSAPNKMLSSIAKGYKRELCQIRKAHYGS